MIEAYIHDRLDLWHRNVSIFLFASRFMAAQTEPFWGPGRVDIAFLRNPFDVDAHRVAPNVGEYILDFGRLIDEKGLDLLFDAAAQATATRGPGGGSPRFTGGPTKPRWPAIWRPRSRAGCAHHAPGDVALLEQRETPCLGRYPDWRGGTEAIRAWTATSARCSSAASARPRARRSPPRLRPTSPAIIATKQNSAGSPPSISSRR
ncbi:hypothetical protein [Rhodovulum sulfidophilum]|uniref:hypothetical protein n=1 Tax=Rhodovulum sulfidophilum TaxID=35806 RepID=UPI0019138182|nr:hypothetical protein [Rhodovulum sulfidophilum]